MRAISSMATRHLLADLGSAAEAAGLGGFEVESVGGVDAARRVAAGEPFDLVFLAEDALGALAHDGHVEGSSITRLALSRVAVGVPSGTAAPGEARAAAAFPDVEGLRAALRGAERIGYSTGPSGAAVVGLIEELGLAAELDDRLVQAPPGVPVARLLADARVDLGFQQLSELAGQPGVRILGVLPDDCAVDTWFAGAVGTGSSQPSDARTLLAFVASDAVAPIVSAHHFASS